MNYEFDLEIIYQGVVEINNKAKLENWTDEKWNKELDEFLAEFASNESEMNHLIGALRAFAFQKETD